METMSGRDILEGWLGWLVGMVKRCGEWCRLGGLEGLINGRLWCPGNQVKSVTCVNCMVG